MTDSCPCCSSATPTKTLQARELTYRLCPQCGSGQLMTLIDFESFYRNRFHRCVQDGSPIRPPRMEGIVNAGLGLTGTGDTLVAWARKGG